MRKMLFFGPLALVGFALFIALGWVWRHAATVPRVRRLVWIAWGVLLVATALAFCFQGAYAGGLGLAGAFRPSVWGDLVGTRLGLVLLARLALVVALFPVVTTAAREPRPRWWTALTALLAGEVPLMCTSPLPTLPHIKSGKLKALAMTGRARSRARPPSTR